MAIDAVVFDMDGLMLDTEPIYKRAWQLAASELGYEIDDAFYLTFIGRQTDDCERTLVERLGPQFPLDTFSSRWRRLWRAEATKGIDTKAGLLELLSFMKVHGVPAAVATSSDADYASFSLRHAGLEGRFDVVVTGDQVTRGKPAPDIYIEAARRLNVEPARCAALEDSEPGIVAARAAGMIGILIPDLAHPTDVAVEVSSHFVRSLHEAQRLLTELVGRREDTGNT